MQETATDAKNLETSREVALLLVAQNSQNLPNLPKLPKLPKACTCAQKLKLS